MDYNVPADVPDEMVDEYIANMNAATAGTGKMNLFACDQKIEHLNDDFYDGGRGGGRGGLGGRGRRTSGFSSD